jgi:F-type H+-transporting ATPase subunit b
MSAAAAVLTAAAPDPNEYPILPHWGELIFGLVTFAILYVVVRRAVFPRLETIFRERTVAIVVGID